jgi:hypothetical protein
MAQIRRLREVRSDVTVIEVSGDITHGEFIKFLEAHKQVTNPASRAIFDFRSANLSALSRQRIKEAMAELKQFARPGLRAALVFSNPADYSIGRVISGSISKQGYLAEIRSFYNLYLAKAWLLYRQPVYEEQTAHRLVAF